MAVPGKLAASSKQDSNLICLPCDRDGLRESVYGFCQDCQEHLCETCFKHHKRSRPSMNHVLLGRDEMPKNQTIDTVRPGDKTDFCANHKDNSLDFYCYKHRKVGCYVCVTLEHKLCEVDYIPDISGSVSDEIRDLMTEMEYLVNKCKTNMENAKTATHQLDLNYKNVAEDIKRFRKEINDRLDHMEIEITSKLEALVNTAKVKQENVNVACGEIAEEVNCSQLNLNYLSEENKQNQLFIEMKHVEDRLSILTCKEKQILEDNETEDDIEFTPNKKIIELLKTENNFGSVSVYGKPSADKAICVQYKGTVSVKSSSDKKECDVTSLVMISPSQMAVADRCNRSIKLIDVENGALISEITLSSAPLDVISLPQNKLAVALTDENHIQILSYTNTGMSFDRRLDVRESCFGIACCQDKLVVACNYNPGKVIILNLAGKVLNEFDSPGLLNGPEKIVISRDEKFLCVSDCFERYKCVKMDWQGNTINVYDEPGYKAPFGIQELEDGTFLVCYSKSNTIVRLSGSCKKCEMKGFEKVNLCRPRAVAYCDRNHTLYVSLASKKGKSVSDTIKVFKVKWM
ncbi:E3 ubiquitin-protein ligase TRIM71-like [Mercenaria mercenaria]|uniref:E3 ubiquitin-protein ligase TRIM71-like n=1 Tax=Mercenaria mercenaria TaxID=6596 RepID=UPI00234EA636|nr:E3 ubiquitin-protein ligase TRIM71-like [Mercenaria mercenaria]